MKKIGNVGRPLKEAGNPFYIPMDGYKSEVNVT